MSFTGGYLHGGSQRSSPQSWASAFGWAMTESLKVINRNQRLRARVKTGALRGSIGFEAPQATSTRVEGVTFAGGSSAPYAKAREFGTGLRSEAEDSKHSLIVIVPKRAKALAWPAPTMGKPGGPRLQLSGNLRTHSHRALVQGPLKPPGVFVFRSRVGQEGQLPDRNMRLGLEDSVEEMMEYAREAALRVLGLG